MIAGCVPILWSSTSLQHALDASLPLLDRARPRTVAIHPTSTRRLDVAATMRVVDDLRRRGVEHVVIEIGADYYAVAPALQRKRIAPLVELLAQSGARDLVINAEAAWKQPGAECYVQPLLDALPHEINLVLSSYDQPARHAAFPWRAFLRAERAIEYAPQCYTARAGAISDRRELVARVRASIASVDTAIRRGWIDRPASLIGMQAYSHAARALIETALTRRAALLWASPSRIDSEGVLAIAALCELERRGYTGATALRDYQRAEGLLHDGLWGPRTRAALLSRQQ